MLLIVIVHAVNACGTATYTPSRREAYWSEIKWIARAYLTQMIGDGTAVRIVVNPRYYMLDTTLPWLFVIFHDGASLDRINGPKPFRQSLSLCTVRRGVNSFSIDDPAALEFISSALANAQELHLFAKGSGVQCQVWFRDGGLPMFCVSAMITEHGIIIQVSEDKIKFIDASAANVPAQIRRIMAALRENEVDRGTSRRSTALSSTRPVPSPEPSVQSASRNASPTGESKPSSGTTTPSPAGR
jgi:hypothetical protein